VAAVDLTGRVLDAGDRHDRDPARFVPRTEPERSLYQSPQRKSQPNPSARRS
jgi:hypothetical protein